MISLIRIEEITDLFAFNIFQHIISILGNFSIPDIICITRTLIFLGSMIAWVSPILVLLIFLDILSISEVPCIPNILDISNILGIPDIFVSLIYFALQISRVSLILLVSLISWVHLISLESLISFKSQVSLVSLILVFLIPKGYVKFRIH